MPLVPYLMLRLKIGDIKEWLVQDLQIDKLVIGKIPSYLKFSSTLWFLWKWRCKQVFDVNFSIPHSPHLIINSFAKDWSDANRPTSVRTGLVIPVAWNPPIEGWIKLNIDGSRDNNSGTIIARGAIQNSSSLWFKGFVMNKGCGSVTEAEL
ncbi:hypothetical protein Ddye_012905 [Dipteronia dyeriana]|uniref:Uncharacterized protein n=1 Tax=Dipteronia dyeriana TaxID=168575 RepID=A0AAE0CJ42_9ROSI|nr:hypothetical protein Ddye_012905 [Dipteronia dyeriana]